MLGVQVCLTLSAHIPPFTQVADDLFWVVSIQLLTQLTDTLLGEWDCNQILFRQQYSNAAGWSNFGN